MTENKDLPERENGATVVTREDAIVRVSSLVGALVKDGTDLSDIAYALCYVGADIAECAIASEVNSVDIAEIVKRVSGKSA